MKNVINYYYNLYPENIFQNKEEYYFFVNNIRYSLIKYLEDINDINKIYNMHLDILNKNMYVHPIILNKDNKPLTIINNEPYILMQTIYYGEKVNIDNIVKFSEITSEKSKNQNWAELWSQKNDYLEYQISMLGKSHPIIRDSFSYYIGLGENAIELVNMVQKQETSFVYAHKRINKNNTTFDLYNPLNMTVDLKVRDAAEYFKDSFFKGEDIDEELTYYFNNTILSTYEYMMFFARMLYPTYYFDLYEEIITNREDDKKLIQIINKANEYEQILKKIYKYYKSFLDMTVIEWLE